MHRNICTFENIFKIYRQGLHVCDALIVDDFILDLTQFLGFGVFL